MAGDLSIQLKQPRHRDHSLAHDPCGFLFIKTTDIAVYTWSMCFSKAIIEIIVYTPSLYFVFVKTIEISVYTGHKIQNLR